MCPMDEVPLLTFSSGCVGSFKVRHGIQEYKPHGESEDINNNDRRLYANILANSTEHPTTAAPHDDSEPPPSITMTDLN